MHSPTSRLMACVLFALSSLPTIAADLVVEVEGLRGTQGVVSVGLFDTAESFPQQVLTGLRTPADKPVVEVVFRNLQPGRYAVSAYQDENGNLQLDRGLFGIPKEPYGFSRDARGTAGPPEFRDARFDLGADGARIRVKLR
ncbi:DUF2141 domain-containing protein [Hylemonella sp. W303a]|uniref:DUF2141 domain-containing protein n=1 Tax=Hylemonella sp. W303a TaxID=3389873 RepID=UPI00396B009D